MHRRFVRAMAPLCLLALACGDAAAQAAGESCRLGPLEIETGGQDRLFFGIGAYDFNQDQEGRTSLAANAEYRFGQRLFGIGPALGLDVNTDGAIYGYLGLHADLALGRTVITPMLAAGGYRRGDSVDLGGVFEFRSALGIAYELDSAIRLGLRITHLSNAGIYGSNPGIEELFATVSVPLDAAF